MNGKTREIGFLCALTRDARQIRLRTVFYAGTVERFNALAAFHLLKNAILKT